MQMKSPRQVSSSSISLEDESDSDSGIDEHCTCDEYRPERTRNWKDEMRRFNGKQKAQHASQTFFFDPATQALSAIGVPRQSTNCEITNFRPVSSKQRLRIMKSEAKKAKHRRASDQRHPSRYQISLQTPAATDIMDGPKNHSITVHSSTNGDDLMEYARKYLKRPDLELRAAMHGYPLFGHETMAEKEILPGIMVKFFSDWSAELILTPLQLRQQ